jgi:K+-sensing histidine kinase KdpD
MTRHVRTYTVSVLAAAAAFLISHAVSPAIEPIRSPLFLAAIVIAAWYGGLGPGLLAAATAAVAKVYFVLPQTALAIADAADVLYLAVFVSVATLVSTLTGRRAGLSSLTAFVMTKVCSSRPSRRCTGASARSRCSSMICWRRHRSSPARCT